MDKIKKPKDIILENLLASVEQLTCLIELIQTNQDGIVLPKKNFQVQDWFDSGILYKSKDLNSRSKDMVECYQYYIKSAKKIIDKENNKP